jgi:hypothetical protein
MACELMPREMVRVAGNVIAAVESIGSRRTQRVEVFGIEVEYFHNYFVGTGANALLVHNGPAKIVRPVTVLNGSTEWVVRDAQVAQRELARLEAEYTRLTGFRPQTVAGASRDAWIDVETGRIFISDQVPQAFREGYLAEELTHYFQLREKSLIGAGKTVSPEVARELEAEVITRVRELGFNPYDPRNYAPYTDIPRPPGVAGNQR